MGVILTFCKLIIQIKADRIISNNIEIENDAKRHRISKSVSYAFFSFQGKEGACYV